MIHLNIRSKMTNFRFTLRINLNYDNILIIFGMQKRYQI